MIKLLLIVRYKFGYTVPNTCISTHLKKKAKTIVPSDNVMKSSMCVSVLRGISVSVHATHQ